MSIFNRSLRLLIFAALALIVAFLVWTFFGVLQSAVTLWQQLRAFPAWAQYGAVFALLAVLATSAYGAWRLLRKPRRAIRVTAPPTRSEVEARIDSLTQQKIDTEALHDELAELDRRRDAAELYVAVFGEISSGKSSLIRALAMRQSGSVAVPVSDVLGGTTSNVAHYRAALGNATVTLADVPGSHEVAGRMREQLARDEALRAHIVLYVCAGDLTRDQDAELRWLRDFGKPLVLLLNKADRFSESERDALQTALHDRYLTATDAQLIISAGGTEVYERRARDGSVATAVRERPAQIDDLLKLLNQYGAHGAAAFEPAREAAVLTAIDAQAREQLVAGRDAAAAALVAKYTKRAVVGALAAVMPGSDLVIQGVLATALIRELSKAYEVPVRDIDIEAFLSQVKLTLRTSASLVLAIAGNAAKAFPGLGTLGGGVLHAIAYGLIFDSLGHAVALSLRERNALDADVATKALGKLLADASASRLRRIAQLALRGANHDVSEDDA